MTETHKTLIQVLIEDQHRQDGDEKLTMLLHDVTTACKAISNALKNGALAEVLGSLGTENIQGETQKKLDVLANDIFLRRCEFGGSLAAMVSEEMDEIYPIPPRYPRGRYILLFDPLDGSSNIDVNVSVGHPDIRLPEQTSEFAINASRAHLWEPPVQRYVNECVAGKNGPRGRDFNMRWVASMVAVVHRILMRGGVFLYPMDTTLRELGGKLRLLYEANPMGFIIEQAQGLATTGRRRILEVVPESPHQRVPVILGSSSEVQRIIDLYAVYDTRSQ